MSYYFRPEFFRLDPDDLELSEMKDRAIEMTYLTVYHMHTGKYPPEGPYNPSYIRVINHDGSECERIRRACEFCGKLAYLQVDPFIREIHEESVFRWLCDDCFQNRKDDI